MASSKEHRVYSPDENLYPACPECKSESIHEDPNRGEYICRDCGFVYQDRLMKGEDARAFTSEERDKRSRYGGALNPFGTVIPKGKVKDATPYTTYRDYRSRRIQNRAPLEVKQEAIGHNEIKRLASQLYVPHDPVEFADIVFKKAHRDHLLKGRSVDAIAAASLYYSCRFSKVPLILEDLLSHTRSFRKDIEKGYRLLVKTYWGQYGSPPLPDPRAYISKFVSQAVQSKYSRMSTQDQESISGEIALRSERILSEEMHKHKYQGKDPKGIAAASVYLGSHTSLHHLSQKEVAQVAQVTEVTLRERVKEFTGTQPPKEAARPETDTQATTKHYKPKERGKSWLLRRKEQASKNE